MPSRLHLSTILFIAAALWGVALLLFGIGVGITWFKPFCIVVGALILILAAFDRWLWRSHWLHGWFVKRPYIRGTWLAYLKSQWTDPKTGESPPTIKAFIAIRQTYSLLSMRLMTEESASELLGAELACAADGTYKVAGVYRNEPRLAVRDRSPIHYGAVILGVEGFPPERLAGHYWTDRDSRGELLTRAHRSTVYPNFESASKAFLQADGSDS